MKLFLQKRARTTKRVFANEEYRIPASIMNIILDDNIAVIHYALDLGYEPAKSHILLLTAAENNNKDLVQRLLSVNSANIPVLTADITYNKMQVSPKDYC